MKAGRAFGAGVVGGLVMTLMTAIARTMGMEVNMEMMEGTMLGIEPGAAAWTVGLMMHLIISGLIGLLYAVGFEKIAHRGGWLAGTGFSLIHIAIGGAVIGMMPMMHPMMPGVLDPPGAFMSNLGAMGIGAFIMLHLIYGAIVGGIYGRATAEVT